MSVATRSSIMRNSFFLLFLNLLLCVVAVCMAQYDVNSKSGSSESYVEVPTQTLTNELQPSVTPAISSQDDESESQSQSQSQSQASTNDQGSTTTSESESESGGGTVAPVYVTALNLETDLVSNADALDAISKAAGVPRDAMAVVDNNNHPIPSSSSSSSLLQSTTMGVNRAMEVSADGFHALRVGFTTVTDAAKARVAIVSGLVPNVRLPPAAPTVDGGLSDRDKIIIGCVIGIGVPLIIALMLAIFCCCCRRKSGGRGVGGYARPEFGDTALIDLDKEVTAQITPAIPLKQQKDHI